MQIVSISDQIGQAGFQIPSEFLFEYRGKFFLSMEGAISLLKALEVDAESIVASLMDRKQAQEFVSEYYNNVEPKYQIK